MEIGRTEKTLLKAAMEAMKNAYVLRGYCVGAAVLGEEGKSTKDAALKAQYWD